MTHEPAFVLRAGAQARQLLEQQGLTPDSLAALGAPAGGPKFLVIAALDRFLFGDWLPQRRSPLPAFGASVGAFRLVAAAHRDPVAAIDRLVAAYCAQHYRERPDAAEITRQVRGILDATLNHDDIEHVLAHPWLQLNLITARCLGLAASHQPAVQAIGFALAFVNNLRHRRRLSASFERYLFHNQQRPADILLPDSFRNHVVRLTPDNLAAATLASGSIPLMMQTVRDIPAAPLGAHIDGGLIDYHMDLPLRESPSGLLFIPHYEQRVVPGWLDKGLRHRRARHVERMLVLSPNPALVARLPGGKIPCRKDFSGYKGRDSERLQAWQAALSLGERIADEFRDMLARADVMTRLQPL